MPLDVKNAIKSAKDYVLHLYSDDEHISNVDLEETEFEDATDAWKITIGFSRPFRAPPTRAAEILDRIGAGPQLRRSFKVITIGRDGRIISMKDRTRADA